MTHESLTLAAAITFAFALAGVVKGIVGLGLPVVAMGLLVVLGIYMVAKSVIS